MKTKTPWKAYGRFGSVGIELVASILIGFFGGRWINDQVGANGWVTVVGFVVGVYAGFRAVFKTAKRMQRDGEETDRANAEIGGEHWEDPGDGPTVASKPEENAGEEVAPGEKPSKTGGASKA